jgi:hypothetical protein
MMFGLDASNTLKIDPEYLLAGLRMGAKKYLVLVLKADVLPWIQANFENNEKGLLMQYGAPYQTTNEVQNWL